MPDLFSPTTVGTWTLPNRIVMAPMTRSRADFLGVPGAATAVYYRQRATAGLIITEGVQPSAVGQGYANTPGLHTPRQIEAWRDVASGVHEEGGRIVAQIMHAGRIAHPGNKNGHETVAPSALAAPGEIVTPRGPRPYPEPRALGTAEITSVVREYADSARSAVEAGLDGIELHGANGYLIHQFLAPSANRRSDVYGGSATARARFAIEVVAAVAEAIGGERVGLRLSPGVNLHGAIEDDPDETAATYRALVDAITPLGLAYLHTVGDPDAPMLTDLRARFDGPLVINDGWHPVTDAATARRYVESGRADLVAVGRAFIANPDLVRRWRTHAPVNEPDPATFYGGGIRGYTDYAALSD
ncbi:alkene reductase [Nocardiopsis sp. NPDC049922]|uniref:alkene reductase n=1 Tax=Nocardiopsis sp. NPDC049922 TaxID=3155157 RepID=UPI0033D8E2C1